LAALRKFWKVGSLQNLLEGCSLQTLAEISAKALPIPVIDFESEFNVLSLTSPP
jgi:hypothetical protein